MSGQWVKKEQSALQYALDYAKEGIPVIWIPAGKKGPYAKGWPQLATTDASVIRKWAHQHPGCNFGLVMGNGWLAIDLDNFEDTGVLDDMGFPETRFHLTSKGAHLLYRVPRNLKLGNKVRLNGLDIDLRHTGGQVVCPGSVHPSGALYRMGDDRAIAELPAEALARLTAKDQARRPHEVREGERNDYLFKETMRLRRSGKEGEELLAALLEVNGGMPLPLDADEVERIATSASKYDVTGSTAAFERLNKELVYVEQPNTVVRLSDFLVMPTQQFRCDYYADRSHFGEDGKPVETARAWMKWSGRSKANGLTFEPGGALIVEENGRRLLNTWKGWGAKPVKGDVKPYLELIDRVFGHLPADLQKWAQQWFAYPIQHPGAKLHSAIVVIGPQATGKTKLGEYIRSVYGGPSSGEVTQNLLDSNFNSWMKDKCFIQGDEVTNRDSRRTLAEVLKQWITGSTVPVHEKFKEPYTLPNRANYYFTSNYDDAFYLNDDDRRYFVVEVRSKPMTAEEGRYFGEWIERQENRDALMWHLQNEVDCSDFNPKGRAPDTDEKEEMKAANRPELDAWCLWLRENPDDPDLLHRDFKEREGPSLPDKMTATQLLFAKDGRNPKCKAETMGRAMKRAGFETPKNDRIGNTSQRRYTIREPAPSGCANKQMATPKRRKFAPEIAPKESPRTRDGGATATHAESESPPDT